MLLSLLSLLLLPQNLSAIRALPPSSPLPFSLPFHLSRGGADYEPAPGFVSDSSDPGDDGDLPRGSAVRPVGEEAFRRDYGADDDDDDSEDGDNNRGFAIGADGGEEDDDEDEGVGFVHSDPVNDDFVGSEDGNDYDVVGSDEGLDGPAAGSEPQPSPPQAKGDGSKASVQYMITRRMSSVLTSELGYLPEEVEVMRPDVAAVVVGRRLKRPERGMPEGWVRDDVGLEGAVGGGGGAPGWLKGVGKGIRKAAPIVAAGWVARTVARSDFVGEVRKSGRECSHMCVCIYIYMQQLLTPRSLWQAVRAAAPAKPAPRLEPEADQNEPDEDLDTGAIGKPGLDDSGMDETWLDKLITAVLVRLSGLLGSKY